MNAQTRSGLIPAAVTSVTEIPLIVLKLFGSFGLFSPCLREDLFAHKDYKRALAKSYKLFDEKKIVMREDFWPCCLLALPLLGGNKVHQFFFLVKQIQVWTTDLFHFEIKNIHINQTVHKIFWEAGNRRLKAATDRTVDRLRIEINLLKLPYEANSKHLRPL